MRVFLATSTSGAWHARAAVRQAGLVPDPEPEAGVVELAPDFRARLLRRRAAALGRCHAALAWIVAPVTHHGDALCEVGAALALGVPVVYVGPAYLATEHPGLLVAASFDESVLTLRRWADLLGADAEGGPGEVHPGRERLAAARASLLDLLREARGEAAPDSLEDRARELHADFVAHSMAKTERARRRQAAPFVGPFPGEATG